MRILLNGAPKSGTHALAKAVELLGIPFLLDREQWLRTSGPAAHMDHVDWPAEIVADRHVLIVRDPRNVLLSWMRASSRPLTVGGAMATLRAYDGAAETFVQHCRRFTPWIDAPGVFVVRYEDLTGDGGATMQRLADHLGVPCPPDAYLNLPGFTATWTGEPSDWRTLWSPEIEAVWVETGGPALLADMGYG